MNKFSVTKEKIVKKAGNSIEKSKLKARLFEIEKKMNGIYEAIGKEIYGAVKSDGKAETAKYISSLDRLISESETIRKRIALLSGKWICDSCGREQDEINIYCSGCGLIRKKPEEKTTE